MFLDFALISGLLVVAHLLRSRIGLFQAILLPTPILAGLIGLAAGPEGLDIIPFARDEGGSPGDAALSGRARDPPVRHPVHGLAGGRTGPHEDDPQRRRHLLLQPLGLDRTVRPRAPVRRRRPDSSLPGGGRTLRADAPLGLRRRTRNRYRRWVHSRRPGPRERHGHRVHLRHHRAAGGRAGGRRGDQPRHAVGLDASRRHPARASRRPAPRADRSGRCQARRQGDGQPSGPRNPLVASGSRASRVRGCARRPLGAPVGGRPLHRPPHVRAGGDLRRGAPEGAGRRRRRPPRGPADDGTPRIVDLRLSRRLRGGVDSSHHRGRLRCAHPGDVGVRLRPRRLHHVVDRPPDLPQLLVRAGDLHLRLDYRGGGHGDRSAARGRPPDEVEDAGRLRAGLPADRDGRDRGAIDPAAVGCRRGGLAAGIAAHGRGCGLLLVSWKTIGFFPADPVVRRAGESR